MPRKNAPKPKYKRRDYQCGACGATTHTARSSACPKRAAPADPGPSHFALKDRGQARKALAASSTASDTIRAEITKREREIAALRASLAVLGG